MYYDQSSIKCFIVCCWQAHFCLPKFQRNRFFYFGLICISRNNTLLCAGQTPLNKHLDQLPMMCLKEFDTYVSIKISQKLLPKLSDFENQPCQKIKRTFLLGKIDISSTKITTYFFFIIKRYIYTIINTQKNH